MKNWTHASQVILLVMFGAGCSSSQSSDSSDMSDPVTEIAVSGFDENGEPTIQTFADGSIRVVFKFMPPSYVDDRNDLGPFIDFHRQMADAIGVEVVWEHREIFLIERPNDDTVAKLTTFIESYPKP